MTSPPPDPPLAPALPPHLLGMLIDRINVGVVTLAPDLTVLQWNRFMEAHSGRLARELVGRNLCDEFPELPRQWLERTVRGVVLLKNFAFTSWQRRPFLFRFQTHRPVTGGTDAMRQDCAFVPLVEADQVRAVTLVILDVTETYEWRQRHDAAMAELAVQSERDALTGVYNRRKIETVLAAEFARARRHGGDLAVLMFDIDHFKRVNDSHGHPVGDAAIRFVARTAVATLRISDIVGRYGGEEFVAVLPELSLGGAAVAAERIRQAVARTPVPDVAPVVSLTISLGVADLRPEMESPQALLAEADKALYRSKAGGRNLVTGAHAVFVRDV